MNTPKMLPWLAKKAGVPFARAEELWSEALSHATEKCTVAESQEYWKVASERLRESLAAEALARGTQPFGLGPLLRLPAQLWLYGLALQESLVAIAATSVRCRQ